MYVYIYIYAYVCMCVCVYMYIYIHDWSTVRPFYFSEDQYIPSWGLQSTTNHLVNCLTEISISPYWAYSQTPIILPIPLRGSVYPHIGSTVRLRHQFAIVLRGSVYIPILGLQSDSIVPVNCLKGISISPYWVYSQTPIILSIALKGSVYPCIWSTVRPTYLRGSVYPFIWVYSQTPNYAPQGDQYIPAFGQQ